MKTSTVILNVFTDPISINIINIKNVINIYIIFEVTYIYL